ncbi:MAG TPA: type II secretion system protein GspM [Gammaproteobacteria bacterium]|nr:type II secretion system protein GspM [Gammaproteobacteria bacterium]
MLNRFFSRSRLQALLILLVLAVGVAAVTLLPLRTAFVRLDESIADLEFRLQKYEAMALLELPLKTQLAGLTSRQESAEGLLQGESQAIAGANLQALFKQIVLNAGGRLESTQVLPGSAAGVMDWIGIRAQFSGNIETLQRVLYGIEFSQPILFVDMIEIRTKRIRRGRRNSPPQEQTQILSVSLEVSGYRRNEESS